MLSTPTITQVRELVRAGALGRERGAGGSLRQLASVLEGLGHEVTPHVVSVVDAIELIATEDPDLAMVVVHKDDEHALALIAETVEYASGPVIAQTRDGDVEFVARAAERGISAWIESLSPEAVQGAI